MRDWQANRLELLEHDDSREWIQVRAAINGQPAMPFLLHKQDREKYKNEDDYLDMLTRQTQSMLATYGDARNQKLDMEACNA